jgi:flagellar biosynthesis/type III secretory pathway M-ring protein FliF/YscJ
MAAPWIFLFVVLLFFMGPFRRRSWRRGPRDDRGEVESWKRDRQALESEREERDRRREEHIETLESRVTELESRLDYAERLLTQRRESLPLGAAPPAN